MKEKSITFWSGISITKKNRKKNTSWSRTKY